MPCATASAISMLQSRKWQVCEGFCQTSVYFIDIAHIVMILKWGNALKLLNWQCLYRAPLKSKWRELSFKVKNATYLVKWFLFAQLYWSEAKFPGVSGSKLSVVMNGVWNSPDTSVVHGQLTTTTSSFLPGPGSCLLWSQLSAVEFCQALPYHPLHSTALSLHSPLSCS